MTSTKKGGRPAIGSTTWARNRETGAWHWHAWITLPDGRPLVPLDPKIPREDAEAARRCAAETSAFLRANPAGAPTSARDSVRAFAERWLKFRRELGLSSVSENERRLRLHILPVIGHLDVTKVTRDDLEALVEKLDGRATGTGAYDWKTAVHIWGDVRKMFSDACRKRALRVRDDNPAENVEPPRRGTTKAKQYLYPSEAVALMRCTRVPLLWRRLFAVSAYLYCRPEELAVLEWKDIDLDHGTVHIHRAMDRVRNKGNVKSTKTSTARRVPLRPELMPLLEAMHARADGVGRVFPAMPAASSLARRLRVFLRAAGIDRDIFTTDETRRRIDWYGATRGTGVTWEAVAGTQPMTIMQRAGHELFSTTLIYVREAENLSAGFGRPFPPLPPDLVDPSGGFDQVSCGAEPALTIEPKTREPGWAQQGLNL